VLTVPHIDDLMAGRLTVSQMRSVEVEDLLGRDAVSLDSKGLKGLIEKKVVLVTGAGGSIGSELCRQIIKFKPDTLICFDISEFALYQLEHELKSGLASIHLMFLVGDIKNRQRINTILKDYKPSLVFHAAAYKHVPMMENYNVIEAFQNNVLGTYELALACQKAKVKKFLLISTDKAINPTNVMGATKRLAEMVCQGMPESSTQFIMVRFGNVLGSSGSVIPRFREQIKSGGPVTVTHPDITRYFMSIPEATQLVMQAGLMGRGGEIFLLDMGEPVKIVDLAKDMIKLSGFDENEIKITFTGLRPGEKLFEELLSDDEASIPTPHPKLKIAKAKRFDQKSLPKLMKWVKTLETLNEKNIKKELRGMLREYTPSKP
jgi:FlaA1/EpsC-like NDP-sugar epimerase